MVNFSMGNKRRPTLFEADIGINQAMGIYSIPIFERQGRNIKVSVQDRFSNVGTGAASPPNKNNIDWL